MTKWQPIEVYDAIKKKPQNAVFRFRPEKKNRGFVLVEAFGFERHMGNRVATHWFAFDLPIDEGAAS